MTEAIVTPIASSTSSTARGSGGRTIGYGEFGDPNGKPVVLFHGFGDSRLTRYPDDDLTARLGIRLITFDRPGIGLTDPMKELTILDRTDDVIDLVNSLGLHDVSFLGWSGGAPFALAAAGCMAGKVKRVAIVSGFGPFERPGFKRLAPREIKRVMTILKVAPWMANVMATESQKGLQGDATAAMEMSRGIGGSSDSSVLNMSGVRANVTSGAEEAFRQGPAGVANDMLLLFRFKWGFNPEDVHTPIDLWYGDDDHMTPPSVGRGLASILPQPRLRMVPGAGHLLYLRNWEEILRTLAADEAPVTATTFQAITPVAPLSPVTETPAAPALGETAPAAEPERAEPAAEPVTAQGDVLRSTPAWSWTQPEGASQPAVEAPAQEPAEREPEGYQEEPVAPQDEPVFTPRPRVASASGDQLARLRALGFIVDVPEPVIVELEVVELEVAEPEVEEPEAAEPAAEEPEAAEPEAEEPEAEEPEAVAAEPVLSLIDAETAATPDTEGVPGEPDVARPDLKLVEPAAAAEHPALAWQPVRVPGLIIGKPRRPAPAVPAIDTAEAERLRAAGFPVGEPASAADAPAAETAPIEHDESRRARLAEDELARLRTAGFVPAVAEPQVVPRDVRAEPEVAAVEVEAVEVEAAEPEAVEVEAVVTDAAEAEALETEAVEVEAVETEALEAEAVEAEALDTDAVETEALEAAAVEAEILETEALETDAVEVEALEAEAEAVTAEVEAVPTQEERVAEAEPAAEGAATAAEGAATVAEGEAEAETEPSAIDDRAATAAEEEPAPVATELEEEASEVVVLQPGESDVAGRLAGAGLATPQPDPAPAIAASAADAPIMKTAARTQAPAAVGDEQALETGVGWVESVPMDVAGPSSAAAAHQIEQDSPPEPMVAGAEDEPAAPDPVRDETLERLRAAGFLIGEPRGR